MKTSPWLIVNVMSRMSTWLPYAMVRSRTLMQDVAPFAVAVA
jgi:hypothetical protein